MRDMDIRCALHEALSAEHGDDPTTRILDELGLCQGNARVDVAVVNGAITGYEIKSDRDTLVRLPSQAEVYNRVLDRVVVVASTSHLDGITKVVPDWWGLLEAEPAGGEVILGVVRPPADNPAVDPYAVAQLLWRDEALAALKERGLDKGLLSKPRRALWLALAENVPTDELRDVVRTQLKARAKWRSDE